jgi:transketolase C-terminal domain/subunit
VRDISALGAVPNLLMAEPAAEAEVHALFEYLVNDAPESAYLRLVSVKWPLPFAYPSNARVQPGKGWIVRPGVRISARSPGRDLARQPPRSRGLRLQPVAPLERVACGG